jgi:hypothetical protein
MTNNTLYLGDVHLQGWVRCLEKTQVEDESLETLSEGMQDSL